MQPEMDRGDAVGRLMMGKSGAVLCGPGGKPLKEARACRSHCRAPPGLAESGLFDHEATGLKSGLKSTDGGGGASHLTLSDFTVLWATR